MVGVGRKALEVDDLRLDGDLLAEELDLFNAVEQSAAQRAGRLEADEHDRAVRAPEVVLEVMADTPASHIPEAEMMTLGVVSMLSIFDSSLDSTRLRLGKVNMCVPSFTSSSACSSR